MEIMGGRQQQCDPLPGPAIKVGGIQERQPDLTVDGKSQGSQVNRK